LSRGGPPDPHLQGRGALGRRGEGGERREEGSKGYEDLALR